ncbi:BsuPI-related putative proteinase inhibitor [Psychrobacillus sp. FJAT-51614]|uniref:Intracellular proteinase inhibitor BsuPI domain-containing protein n=1 Tax=Psychrobacillus mangrovi TaxID=3117745 RepID=A0ABU8F4H0_9BACI
MKIIKRIPWVLLLAISLLASCGTTSNVDQQSGSEEESFSTRLDITAEGDASFIIINQTNEETILTMSSGQQIEFQLLNEAKEVVYTYSANKMFIQEIEEKKLQPGEKWAIPLNLQEELLGVLAGSYNLVVWSTAEGLEDLKVETDYDWAGDPTSHTPGKLVVESQEVTYVGQIDLHSIEVKNLDGATEVMRLSEVAIPFFEGLEESTQILVEYVVENEQKVIQSTRLTK